MDVSSEVQATTTIKGDERVLSEVYSSPRKRIPWDKQFEAFCRLCELREQFRRDLLRQPPCLQWIVDTLAPAVAEDRFEAIHGRILTKDSPDYPKHSDKVKETILPIVPLLRDQLEELLEVRDESVRQALLDGCTQTLANVTLHTNVLLSMGEALLRASKGDGTAYRVELAILEINELSDLLVTSNAGIAKSVASKFADHGTPFPDLVEAGLVGLMIAVEKFDPTVGTQFSTYAIPWVMREVRRSVYRDSGFSITELLFRQLRQLNLAEDKLSQELNRAPTQQELETRLKDLDVDLLFKIASLRERTRSMDSPISDDDPRTLHEDLPSNQPDPGEEALSRLTLRIILEHLSTLSERDQIIIKGRFFHHRTAAELGEQLNMKPRNVFMVHSRALRRLYHLCRLDPRLEAEWTRE